MTDSDRRGGRSEQVVLTTRLRDACGEEVVLTEDGRESGGVHRIVLEFDVGGRSYAALRPVGAKDAEELSVFRVVSAPNGEPVIETIEDDDEWEDIFELVDEMMFSSSSKEED